MASYWVPPQSGQPSRRKNQQDLLNELMHKYHKKNAPSPVLRDILRREEDSWSLVTALRLQVSLIKCRSLAFEDGQVTIYDRALLALSDNGNEPADLGALELYLTEFICVVPIGSVGESRKIVAEHIEMQKRMARVASMREAIAPERRSTRESSRKASTPLKSERHGHEERPLFNDDSLFISPASMKEAVAPERRHASESTRKTAPLKRERHGYEERLKSTDSLVTGSAGTKEATAPERRSTRESTRMASTLKRESHDYEERPLSIESLITRPASTKEATVLEHRYNSESTRKTAPLKRERHGNEERSLSIDSLLNRPSTKEATAPERRHASESTQKTSPPLKRERLDEERPKSGSTVSDDTHLHDRVERILDVYRRAKDDYYTKKQTEGIDNSDAVRFLRDTAENALTYLRSNKLLDHKMIPELESVFRATRDAATKLSNGRKRRFEYANANSHRPAAKRLRGPHARGRIDSYRPR